MEALDNLDKRATLSSRNSKKPEVKTEAEEKEVTSPHQTSKKSKIAQEKEKIPHILHKKANDSATDQYRHRRPRKFQTPLQKDVLENTLKCRMEVGLITPQGKSLVALATVQATERKSEATDGQPLDDFIEVLVNTVFTKATSLPRPQGKISKLGSACGRCIPWPRHGVAHISTSSVKRGSSAQKNSTTDVEK